MSSRPYFPNERVVPCGLCGTPTTMLGTKRCDRCYELESRVNADPELTQRILASGSVDKAPRYSLKEIESAGERFRVASADERACVTGRPRRKCEQCGEGGAPLHEDLGVRLCDENCRECWLSCQSDGERAQARAERDGQDESYLDLDLDLDVDY